MQTSEWRRIWNQKAEAADPTLRAAESDDQRLATLLESGGFATPHAHAEVEGFRAYAAEVMRRLGAAPGASVYDVGCGGGAFLLALRQLGHRVGGLDYAEAQIALARRALPGADLTVGEARSLTVSPRYDWVVSNSAFFYFPSLSYAREVLARMVQKARHGVAVLDVNDGALASAFLAQRRSAYPEGEYDRRYAGLSQLSYQRAWFAERAEALGMECAITTQFMPNYQNARFRFNVFLRVAQGTTRNS